jgi:hypothetical protein
MAGSEGADMHCVLCGLFDQETSAEVRDIPAPIIPTYRAPGNRAPVLTTADYGHSPNLPSRAAKMYERSVTRTADIGPTDDHNRFTIDAARGGFIRSVDEKYVILGGPACTADNQPGWGWVHNYGYLTIADTLKPAQQLPRYNHAAVDTETILDRAKKTVLRALYGGGK